MLNGANGYIYSVSFAAATTSTGVGGTALDTDSWYKFTAISTGTTHASVQNLKENDVTWNSTGVALTLSPGDKAQKMTITKLGFATDISDSESKEKFEQTVQTDDVKSYQVGSKPEVTGTVNGYFEYHSGSTATVVQRDILSKFRTVLRESTGHVLNRTSPDTDVFHSMLSLSEGTTDKYELWAYKPMIIDSLTLDKPMEGPINFSFNYTEDGSEKPNMFYKLTTN
jgi:hypothetical protein